MIARILNRKGMFPSAASNVVMVSSPMSDGWAARCSASEVPSTSVEGELECVPIHNYGRDIISADPEARGE